MHSHICFQVKKIAQDKVTVARQALFQAITIVEREENRIQLQETKSRKTFKCWSQKETIGQLYLHLLFLFKSKVNYLLYLWQDIIL